MPNTVDGVHGGGDHASRPAATAVTAGSLYACTDHTKVYKSDGSTWSDWHDGSGGVGGGGALTQISQYVESGGGSATITFASIPGTYEDLILSLVGRSSAAATAVGVAAQFNNDTGANYDWQRHYVEDGNAVHGGSESINGTSARVGAFAGASMTANIPGVCELIIPAYARTTFDKLTRHHSQYQTVVDATNPQLATEYGASRWDNVAAITEIDLSLSSGNFIDGTVATLWGRT